MKCFRNRFRRMRKSNPASANRPRSFRPQLEQLDSRLVPTMVSSAISIPHNWGWLNWTERDWYALDNSTLQVVEFQGTSRHNLGGPAGVTAVSASIDPKTGFAEVFVLDSNYALWLCDSSSTWHSFGGRYEDISASRDGHVYAVSLADLHVRYLDSNGSSTDLAAPKPGILGPHWSYGNTSILAASVGWFGSNEVFAVGSDLAIYVNSGNDPGQWRLIDNSRQFVNLSATVNDTVFAMTTDWKLYQETEHFQGVGWYGFFYWSSQDITGGKQWYRISADTDASGRDEVYAIDTGWTAYLYDQGSWTWKDSDVNNINGADGGYFYDVNYAGGSWVAWLYNPNGGWNYLSSGIW
jgi:hypothetical protein